MKETKFSTICKVTSNAFLVLAIIAPIVIAWHYGKVEDYQWKWGEGEVLAGYVRDWGLTVIYYIATFVPLFLSYVIFGSLSEHLSTTAWIASRMGYKEKKDYPTYTENGKSEEKEKSFDDFVKGMGGI